jgi:hypothetical protein
MAQGDGTFYNKGRLMIASGEISFGIHQMRVALVESYSPNIASDHYWADISAYEVAGDGYDEGGRFVSGETLTENDGIDRAVYDGNDVIWPSLSCGTPSHAVMYCYDHPLKPLMCYWELGLGSDGTDYSLIFGANGIVQI